MSVLLKKLQKFRRPKLLQKAKSPTICTYCFIKKLTLFSSRPTIVKKCQEPNVIEIISPLSLQLLLKRDKNICKTLGFIFFFYLLIFSFQSFKDILLHFSYHCLKKFKKQNMNAYTFPNKIRYIFT